MSFTRLCASGLLKGHALARGVASGRVGRASFAGMHRYPAYRTFSFLSKYDEHVEERATSYAVPIDPKPLDAAQVTELIDEVKVRAPFEALRCFLRSQRHFRGRKISPPKPLQSCLNGPLQAGAGTDEERARLLELFVNRVPPGVDEAAYVKASYLAALASEEEAPKLEGLDRAEAVKLLGTMQGGYNVAPLVQLLSDEDEALAASAAEQLKRTLLVFDAFYDIEALAKDGNVHAKAVMQSWADAEWFLERPEVPECYTVTVFKVTGETNTDDLSPAPDAWSRPDIPLHGLAMLKNARDGIDPIGE